MAVLLAWSGTVAASPVPLTPRLPPHVGLGGTPAAGQEAQVVPEPGVGFGRAASARMWGRKRARHVSYVTGFTGLDPQPAAGTGGRKRCSFPRSPGGQADGCTHIRIHPSLSHPVIPARFQRSIWEPLCSCWHKPKWLLWGRIPPVLKISLRSSSLSAGNSLHSWRIRKCLSLLPFSIPSRRKWHCLQPGCHGAAPTPCCSSELPARHLHPAPIWTCPDVPGQECCQPSDRRVLCCLMHLLLPSPGR